MIDTAIIMAAGKGTRFGSRTESMPKGFIKFKGKPMIERSIENLLSAGIGKIIIGTGYHKEWYESLTDKYPMIRTVFSPAFAASNSMETLYQCKDAVGDAAFLLLESDIIYQPHALTELLNDPHENIMLVSPVKKFQDQYYIAADKDLNLSGCSTDKEKLKAEHGEEPYGELIGIHKVSNAFYRRMLSDYETHREEKFKRGYEFELEDIAVADPSIEAGKPTSNSSDRTPARTPLFLLKLDKLQWYEIDDEQDLKFAEQHVGID